MPKDDYFAKSSTEQIIKTPAAVTTDGNTAGIDITQFRGQVMALASILNTAGTAPTMDIKLQSTPDADVVNTVGYTGTGNGTLTDVEGGPDAVAENITITFSNATTAAVVGSVSGALGSATVGTKFTSAKISFLLTAGEIAFVNLDAFTVGVLARTYTDVVAFTQVTGSPAGSIQRKTFNIDEIGRYIRANLDIGGTVGPSFDVGIAIYGMQN